MEPRIIYTYTDEAPMLATHAFLPIIQAFSNAAGVTVEIRDISLAARILAAFPDNLPAGKRVPDALAELGELVKLPDANIIKLPNISASIPQIQAAVKELQCQGLSGSRLSGESPGRMRNYRNTPEIRQGEGQRGKSGDPGREFRSALRSGCETVRPEKSPFHGSLVEGFENACFQHVRRRFLRQ